MRHLIRRPVDAGHALRAARRARGLTQRALAEKSGVWQETISRIEGGAPGTRLDTLLTLCAALEIDLWQTPRSAGDDDFEALF